MYYKCIVQYNGYLYNGWQKQKHCISIQETIEKSLEIIFKENIDIVASGRTDAKVHALGQVFHFQTVNNISCERVIIAINNILPKDIRILNCEYTTKDFHARFSAKSKRYDYYLSLDQLTPFNYQMYAYDYRDLNIDLMKEACSLFLGEHDFTSFTSSKIDPRKPRIKNIKRSELIVENNVLHFIFEGNGFLRYMIRIMVGTLIEVGCGRKSLEDIKNLLDNRDKEACKFKADPHGLYLHSVNYNE